MVLHKIKNLPIGYSKVEYKNRTYGVSRTDFNNGKSTKLFAEELGGTDFISLNCYTTSQQEILKPCEMPMQKVVHFLNHFNLKDEL